MGCSPGKPTKTIGTSTFDHQSMGLNQTTWSWPTKLCETRFCYQQWQYLSGW